jgi:rubrerythrin
MGNRDHLHVCQQCGIVHAVASSTGPERCVVCRAVTFTEYELTDVSRERRAAAADSRQRLFA